VTYVWGEHVARFRVQIYRDMQDDVPDEERIVSASDHAQAAALLLRSIGGGGADWIRVEEQTGQRSIVCFLDSVCGGNGFAYEASYARGHARG